MGDALDDEMTEFNWHATSRIRRIVRVEHSGAGVTIDTLWRDIAATGAADA
ncbi:MULTISPECIES: hypothetical protein [unclassified Cryobacterium]|uniref:hypothetical protein n=1 Tax=unclassified Cryobacterium TaxID=2649013 RepID=UPI00141B612F|nr:MULTISPECIES: hypothetical protein [unclassified Cryobacterium]